MAVKIPEPLLNDNGLNYQKLALAVHTVNT